MAVIRGLELAEAGGVTDGDERAGASTPIRPGCSEIWASVSCATGSPIWRRHDLLLLDARVGLGCTAARTWRAASVS